MRFPHGTKVIFVVEFFERLAYYAVTFTLTTYCTTVLRLDSSHTNAIVNTLYIVSPLASCFASGVSDGTWGRRRTLLRFLCVYAAGLVLVALSSSPVLYREFPNNPTPMCAGLLVAGVVVFGVGYGGMKVCTSPLMADCLSRKLTEDGCHTAEAKSVAMSHLFLWAYWIINLGSLAGLLAAPFMRELDSRTTCDGHYAGYYYGFWMAAASTTLGTILFALRYHVVFPQEVEERSSFILLRILLRGVVVRAQLILGLLPPPPLDDAFFCPANLSWWSVIPYAAYSDATTSPDWEEPTSPSSGKGRPLVAPSSESQGEERHARGSDTADATNHGDDRRRETCCLTNACPPDCRCATEGRLVCRCLRRSGHDDSGGSSSPRAGLMTPTAPPTAMFSREQVAAASRTLHLCRTFVCLPLYWLISNQFSTNVVLQASDLEMPSALPPDLLNNVNTISLLLLIFVLDGWVYPRFYGEERKPSVVMRWTVGFAVVSIAMFWCGLLQVMIDKRGTTVAVVSDSSSGSADSYVLNPGESRISAAWVLPPYILQGCAAALVDTTTLETAYTVAPKFLKSSVMALYLLASSVSGFAGLALSPIMTPGNISAVFFALGVLQVLVALIVRFSVAEEVDGGPAIPMVPVSMTDSEPT